MDTSETLLIIVSVATVILSTLLIIALFLFITILLRLRALSYKAHLALDQVQLLGSELTTQLHRSFSLYHVGRFVKNKIKGR